MDYSKKPERKNPRKGANVLSQLLFLWIVPLMFRVSQCCFQRRATLLDDLIRLIKNFFSPARLWTLQTTRDAFMGWTAMIYQNAWRKIARKIWAINSKRKSWWKLLEIANCWLWRLKISSHKRWEVYRHCTRRRNFFWKDKVSVSLRKCYESQVFSCIMIR